MRSVDVSPNLDATQVTATYTFDAPGRAWGPEDNGTYQISLNEAGVRDGLGQGATAPPVSFNRVQAEKLRASQYSGEFASLEATHQQTFAEKRATAALQIVACRRASVIAP